MERSHHGGTAPMDG